MMSLRLLKVSVPMMAPQVPAKKALVIRSVSSHTHALSDTVVLSNSSLTKCHSRHGTVSTYEGACSEFFT